MSTGSRKPPLPLGSLPYYGDPPMLAGTYASQPCGCEIIGNGTLPHPLAIKRCAKHEAAMQMYEAIDPEALESIAVSIAKDYPGSASRLRELAQQQRDAMPKADDQNSGES